MSKISPAPDPVPVRTQRQKSLLKRIAPWAVLIAIFIYLFHRIPLQDLIGQFHSLSATSLSELCVLSLVFVVGVALIDGTVMWYGFSLFKVPIKWKEIVLVRSAMMLLASIATPIGQAGLAAHIARKHKVPAGPAAGMVMYLFLLEAFGMIALATLSLPLYLLARGGTGPEGAPVELALAMVALAWPGLAIVMAVGKRATGVKIVERLRLDRLLYPLQQVSSSQMAAILAQKTALAAWQMALTFAAFRIYGIHAPALDLFAFMPLAILFSAIPIAPGRLGITQVSWVFFFGYLLPGKEGEAALMALSLLLQFLLNVARWLVGAAALPFVYSDLAEARAESAAEDDT